MRTETTSTYIRIIADDGMELVNGEIHTNQVTSPIGTDLSEWIEIPVFYERTDENLNTLANGV